MARVLPFLLRSVRYSGIYSGRRERRSAFLNKKIQGVTIRTEKLPVNLISAGSFYAFYFVKIPPTGKKALLQPTV